MPYKDREVRLKKQREYWQKVKYKYKGRYKPRNINAWKDYLSDRYGEPISCQICDRELSWYGNPKNVVCLDHSRTDSKVKESPYHWLRCHTINETNIKVFEEEKFGFLCRRCNYFIGPHKQKQRIVDYILNQQKGKHESNLLHRM